MRLCFPLPCCRNYRALHSFPTRRSSDLGRDAATELERSRYAVRGQGPLDRRQEPRLCGVEIETRHGSVLLAQVGDRKSTRLNSSHTVISYAVFCLKKKTETSTASTTSPR